MFRDVVGVNRKPRHEVLAQDLPGRLGIRTLDLDFHVQTTGAQNRRIDHVFAVRCPDYDHVLQALHAINLTQELRHDGVLDVTLSPLPRVRNNESISSKKTMTTYLRTPSPCRWERDGLALRFANVLVQ